MWSSLVFWALTPGLQQDLSPKTCVEQGGKRKLLHLMSDIRSTILTVKMVMYSIPQIKT